MQQMHRRSLDRVSLLSQKLLSLFCIAAEFVRSVKHLVSLHERQIGSAVFRGPALDLRLLHWRELRLQFAYDLLGQVSLNSKHIGQVAIVIFRPHVLVVCGVDQLNVHAHPIADAANAAFQNGTNPQRLSDFTKVGCFSSIWHDRRT